MKRVVISMLAAVVVLLAACKDDDVAVTGVTLDESTLSIVMGDNSKTLTATVLPADATKKGVQWTVAPASGVITLSATTGATVTITTVAAGTATITVTTDDGAKTASCAVTVTPDVVNVESVSLDKTTFTFTALGQTETLTPTVLPADASNKSVTWSTSAAAVATVDGGVVTAVGPGTATITVTTVDGSKTATCAITVDVVLVTGITLNPPALDLYVDATETIVATVAPEGATNKELEWTIEPAGVATVDQNGLVTAVAVGTATITVAAKDGSGVTASCEVEVTEGPAGPADFDRTNWTVTTQTATDYGYAMDPAGSAGGGELWDLTGHTGNPYHMFDDLVGTCLFFVKPGKGPYNNAGAQSGEHASFLPSFTVDMKEAKAFNYIVWQHRNGASGADYGARGANNNANHRVFAVNVYGSNDPDAEDSKDNTLFTKLNTEGLLWIPNVHGYVGNSGTADQEVYRLDLGATSTFQYVKIEVAMWSDAYGRDHAAYTEQITHPDYVGQGDNGGTLLGIAEFNLGLN